MFSMLSHLLLADPSNAAGAGLFAGLGIFMIIVWGIALLATIFVIWMLIDCLTSSMPVGEKILWAVVIIFLHLIGALIYYFVKRTSARGTSVSV